MQIRSERMKRNPATLREAHFEATVTGFEFFLEIREEIKVGPAWTIGSLGQPGLLGAWASLAGPPGIREIRRVNSKRVTVASKWVSRNDL